LIGLGAELLRIKSYKEFDLDKEILKLASGSIEYSGNRTLRSCLICSCGATGIDPAVNIIYREYSGILLDNSA
jgi:hypothetical protein